MAYNQDGRVEIFALTQFKNHYEFWRLSQRPGTYDWTHWRRLPQRPNEHYSVQDIELVKNKRGNLELFYRDSSGQVYHVWQPAPNIDTFDGWNNLGQPSPKRDLGSITACPQRDGTLVLFGDVGGFWGNIHNDNFPWYRHRRW